jgi:hypothetical protein
MMLAVNGIDMNTRQVISEVNEQSPSFHSSGSSGASKTLISYFDILEDVISN